MSKAREAWEVIKKQTDNTSRLYASSSFNVVEELVTRDEPKQVNHLHPLKSFGKCPTCNKSVHILHHRQFCGECGTRLEWRKDE